MFVWIRERCLSVRAKEATTGADILCEAMDALKAECWGSPGEAVEVQSPKPQPEAQSSASAEEPFIPGLPPEALRKAWPPLQPPRRLAAVQVVRWERQG
jgi:hypothetical protein